jgi:hypothetical protein
MFTFMPQYTNATRLWWLAGLPLLVLLFACPISSLNICDYNTIIADMRAEIPTGMGQGGGRPRGLLQTTARGDAIGGRSI